MSFIGRYPATLNNGRNRWLGGGQRRNPTFSPPAPEVTSQRGGGDGEWFMVPSLKRWNRHHLHLTYSQVLTGSIRNPNEAACDWCTATLQLFCCASIHDSVVVVALSGRNATELLPEFSL